jgi:hypothetical protein
VVTRTDVSEALDRVIEALAGAREEEVRRRWLRSAPSPAGAAKRLIRVAWSRNPGRGG